MGTFYTENLAVSGVEKDFLWGVYNWITGLDSGITCEIVDNDGEHIGDNPDDMTWENDIIKNVDFTLDTGVVLRLQSRPYTVNGKLVTNGYNIGFYCGGGVIANKNLGTRSCSAVGDTHRFHDRNQALWGPTFAYSDNAVRSWNVSKYISDNCLIVWIGTDLVTDWKNSEVSFMKFKDTNGNWKWCCLAGASGATPIGGVIENASIVNSDGSGQTTKSPMFSYEAKMGYLDFISHSSFVSGSTKAFSSTDIYDSTTVAMGDTYSVENGVNFLAIGAHSLVRLDE